jgi:hypothetical protein
MSNNLRLEMLIGLTLDHERLIRPLTVTGEEEAKVQHIMVLIWNKDTYNQVIVIRRDLLI